MIKFYNNLNDLEVRQNNIANARTELKNIIDESLSLTKYNL